MSVFVANASPLIAFRQLEQTDLLHTLVGTVLIPPAVVREVFHSTPLPTWVEPRAHPIAIVGLVVGETWRWRA